MRVPQHPSSRPRGSRHAPRYWLGLLLIGVLCGISSCGDCMFCGGDVPIKPTRASGSLIISVEGLTGLATGDRARLVSVAYSGTQQSGGDGTGAVTFSTTRSHEVTTADVTPPAELQRKALKPGRWEVRVQAGDWSAAGSGDVAANGNTRFTFHYGNPGCSVQ